MTKEYLMSLKDAIINQDSKAAVENTNKCLKAGIDSSKIIDAISSGLKEVGGLFERQELFLPEVMRAANAAKTCLNIVIPLVQPGKDGRSGVRGRVAMGSLGPHDIGKTIVASMLIADGFDVIDMGVMLNPEKVERLLKEEKADVLGLSVLLTSDISKSAEIIKRARGINTSIKVMVGGAAMSPKVAKEIGANAFGKDANEAVAVANQMMEGKL